MKISDKFILKVIDDEKMLIPVKHDYASTQKIINLNDTSFYIYSSIKNGLSEEQVISKMMEEYEVDKDTLTKDVHNLLKQFIELGVIDE